MTDCEQGLLALFRIHMTCGLPEALQSLTMSSKQGTQVIVRVRPFNERERASTAQASCLDVLDGHTVLYTGREVPASSSFGFDAVLDQKTTQAEVFEVRRVWESRCG